MIEGLEIRDMQASDIEEVEALERVIFETPWSGDIFRHELSSETPALYLVAVHRGTVIGYMGSQVVGREIHITNMAVEEKFRKRGAATSLMVECVHRAADRGARWLSLEVRENNMEARRFYKRFGFQELGIMHGYYVDSGENAVVMATGDILTEEFQRMVSRYEAGRVEGEDS